MGKSLSVMIRDAELHVASAQRHLAKLRSMEAEIKELSKASDKLSFPSSLVKFKGLKGSSVKKKSRRGAPRGKRIGPTIGDQIYDVIRDGGGLASGDVVKKMSSVRPSMKAPSVYTTLNKLQKDGRLKKDGRIWRTLV